MLRTPARYGLEPDGDRGRLELLVFVAAEITRYLYSLMSDAWNTPRFSPSLYSHINYIHSIIMHGTMLAFAFADSRLQPARPPSSPFCVTDSCCRGKWSKAGQIFVRKQEWMTVGAPLLSPASPTATTAPPTPTPHTAR